MISNVHSIVLEIINCLLLIKNIELNKDNLQNVPYEISHNKENQVNNLSAPVHRDIPLLIPLPFKGPPFFAEACLYFVQNQKRGKYINKKENSLTLLLVLKTANLGLLRLFLIHKETSLVLNWITQTQKARVYLEQNFRELESKIKKAGYTDLKVNFQCLSGTNEINHFVNYPEIYVQEPIFNRYV